MRRRKAGRIVVGAVVLLLAGVAGWYYLRPQPGNAEWAIARGVITKRFSISPPRPVVVTWVEIDRQAPFEVIVTPPSGGGNPYRAATTSDFLRQTGCTVAINADFFRPFKSNSILDYYPHAGDLCEPYGLTIREGEVIAKGDPGRHTVYFDKTGQPSFDAKGAWNAVSGHLIVLRNGKPDFASKDPYHTHREPRTLFGWNDSTLFLVVIDGRQPNFSDGATIREAVEFLVYLGVENAVNLDGGGSSTLVDRTGALNTPIDCRIPGRQRAVANHLGFKFR